MSQYNHYHLDSHDDKKLTVMYYTILLYKYIKEKRPEYKIKIYKSFKDILQNENILKNIVIREQIKESEILYYKQITKEESDIVKKTINKKIDIKIYPFNSDAVRVSFYMESAAERYYVKWVRVEVSMSESSIKKKENSTIISRIHSDTLSICWSMNSYDNQEYDGGIDELIKAYDQQLHDDMIRLLRFNMGL